MAKDVITRFRLETTQFDSKIKSAAKGLAEYTKAASNAGKEFQKFTKDNVAAAQALGKMATSSQDAKGKVKELVGAFNEAAKAYNALTKEQQQSDFGKAMAASLTQLQQRIRETKAEMQSMGNMSKNTGGGIFSGIGSKMEGALAVFGGNLMTKAAGAVAQLGSEMADMVKQGIEMAKAGEGVRIAFERLGRGDILQGLREATHGTVTDLELMKAAVKFNDFKLPVEELGTMLAFAQQKAKDTGQSVDYMVDSIVTGLGRKSLMILDNLGLSANEIKEKMKQTGDMTKAVGAIIRDQMAKAGDYVETAADRAAQANVSLQNKMEELGRKFGPVEEASTQLWTSMKIAILDVVGGPLARLLNGLTEAGRLKNMLNDLNGEPGSGNTKVDQQLKKLNVIKKAGGSDYIFNSTLNGMMEDYNRQIMALDAQIKNGGKRPGAGSGESQDVRYLQQKIDALKIMRDQLAAGAKEINKPIKIESNIPDATGGGSGKGGRSGGNTKAVQTELQQNQTKINTLQQEYVRLGDEATESSRQRQIEIQNEIQLLQKRNGLLNLRAEQAMGRLLPVDTSRVAEIAKEGITGNPFLADNKAMEYTGSLKLQLDEKAMKAVTKDIYKNSQKEQDKNLKKEQAIEGMSDLIGGVNNVFGGLQQMGIEIPQEIQSVMGVLNGIFTVVTGIESIITVGQFLGIFHNGGIVPHAANGYFVGGTHYSGDVTPIMANAGELVLSKAQQGNIASQLEGAGLQNLRLSAEVQGEKIVLVANRYFKRTGQGEIVTWK